MMLGTWFPSVKTLLTYKLFTDYVSRALIIHGIHSTYFPCERYGECI